MSVIDTTTTIDSTTFLKSKIKNNKVASNYYIETMQEKRNRDWEYRYNVVGIETEAVEKQIDYTKDLPDYKPLEVVITNIKNDSGEDLGTDWARLAFKDLKHPNKVGHRYRFSLDFPEMANMSEEEKHYNTSIWIAVNSSPITTGNSCVVRRCNNNFALIGSVTGKQADASEIRYEPCILENNLKYMNIYYNQSLVVPQAELYAFLQMNYFTSCIKLNDRIILGGTDLLEITNNYAYKVKAVIKQDHDTTFFKEGEEGNRSVDLVILALDKDTIASEDILSKRVANNAPIYRIPKVEEQPEAKSGYYIKLTHQTQEDEKIILGNTLECSTALYAQDVLSPTTFEYTYKLNGILAENWYKYFEFVVVDGTHFTIKNLKACNRGTLDVTAKCLAPDGSGDYLEETFKFKLGGFY